MLQKSGAGAYRYGFNGKENDNDVKGYNGQQDYGMRIYDPRVGRFLSVDPITKDYPELTPYQFASNRPIDGIDLDGQEWAPPRKWDPQLKRSVVDSKAAVEQHTALARVTSAMVFKSVFPQELPKKFIDHYAWGKGKPYHLTPNELEQIRVAPTGVHGGVANDVDRMNKLLEGINPGASMKLPAGYSIQGAAFAGGTLGRFTIQLEGTITKRPSGAFDFTGRMRFYDVYDFQTSPIGTGDMQRSNWGDFQTGFAKVFLLGQGFEVISDWIPVEQHNEDFFDWFKGKSSEPTGNEFSTGEGAREVQNTSSEQKEIKP